MESIGQRIKALRERENLTQQQLADAMGESSGRVIYNWEKGFSRPDSDKIVKLCACLHVSSDELLGCTAGDDKPTSDEWNVIRQYRGLDEHGKQAVRAILDLEYDRSTAQPKKKVRMLAIDFYRIPASAGTGTFLDSEEKETVYIPDTKIAEDADYMLEVRGDSMEPTFSDGDRILIQNGDSVDVGGIGIFVINGDVYVKELGNGQLISHNKAYKPIPLRDSDSIYCCGKVLGKV